MVNVFEDEPEDEPEDSEDSEDKKSGSESSDDEELVYDELEEFRNSNADCTSGSVEFIGDNDEPPIELCPADSDASEDRARDTEDEVRSMIIRIKWH